MILARKLLIPTLALFALVLTGMLAYIYLNYQAENRKEETRLLSAMNSTYGSELENFRVLALSLASETANDPAIQQAFAARDRERLLQLTQTRFERLQEYNVAQYQFHLPPAISFLRVHAPDRFGDDLSSFRSTVVTANLEQRAVSGVESGRAGLGVRAVVPMFYENQHMGSVEYGLNIGEPLLEHLQEELGGEWHILITRQSMANALPEELAKLTDGPTIELLLLANTQDNIFYGPSDSYASALQGQTAISHTQTDGRTYAMMSAPLYDYSDNIIGVLDIIQDTTTVIQTQNRTLLVAGLIGVILLALIGIGMSVFMRRTLQPIQDLTAAATNITGGDLTQEINIATNDEIGVLSTAFNNMTIQLRSLISGLEERVAERTRDLQRRTLDLEILAEVARDITTVRNLDVLLKLTASLIRDRFGYYHVGIFLLDERREYAVLRAANSDAAATMLEQQHKLKVGEGGIVGYVASTGSPRIALDVGADAVHFRNPLLPETRSEIGLPLRSRGLTIGVLDIQAKEPSAFDQQNIGTFQLLADELVAAIENAELVERAENTLKELNVAYQSQTQLGWQKAIATQNQTALEYDGLQVKPVSHPLPTSVITQLESGRTVVMDERNMPHGGNGHHSANTLLIPLMALNQVVGVIGLEQENPHHVWTSEEIAIAEAAANRAAITLENARLLETAQRRALKEQTISEISAKIGSLVDLDNILQTTIQELSRSMPDAEVAIQFHKMD